MVVTMVCQVHYNILLVDVDCTRETHQLIVATESAQAAKEHQISICFICDKMIPKDSSKRHLHIGKHILKALRKVAEASIPVNAVCHLISVYLHFHPSLFVSRLVSFPAAHAVGLHRLEAVLSLLRMDEADPSKLPLAAPCSLGLLTHQLSGDPPPHHAPMSQSYASSASNQLIPN